MKEQCKQAIIAAMITNSFLPEKFSFGELLDEICGKYGTEFTAACLLEMEFSKTP